MSVYQSAAIDLLISYNIIGYGLRDFVFGNHSSVLLVDIMLDYINEVLLFVIQHEIFYYWFT